MNPVQMPAAELGNGVAAQPLVAINAAVRPPAVSRTTAEVACPRSMVGRVIGKNGETIKALQTYTGALIQIDQSTDPTRVTISGTPQSLQLAMSMVTDICKGTFKGFALLRQLIQPQRPGAAGVPVQPRPVYAPGYGLIPPSQLYGPDDQPVLQATPVSVIGAMPQTTLLQPGFQYVQTTPIGDTQVVLGLPPGIQTHTLAPQDGTTLLTSMPVQQALPLTQVQQMPLQQVYGGMPLASGGFGTQVATYYPTATHDFNTASANDTLGLGQDSSAQYGALHAAQLSHLSGSNTSKMLAAGSNAGSMSHMRHSGGIGLRPQGIGAAGGQVRSAGPGSGGSSWMEGATKVDNTMGQVVMNDLLGGNSGASGSGLGSLSGQQQVGGNQLLRVIGPEGVSFYLQGAGDQQANQGLR